MAKQIEWVNKHGMWISHKPVLRGVWRRRDGGHFVRARVKSQKDGKVHEITKALPGVLKASEALRWLVTETEKRREGTDAATATPRFKSYAILLLARKISSGEIESAATIERWQDTLEHHLCPVFGEFFLDKIRVRDVRSWTDRLTNLMKPARTSPSPKVRPNRSLFLKVGTRVRFDDGTAIEEKLEDATRVRHGGALGRVVIAKGTIVDVEHNGRTIRISRTAVIEFFLPEPVHHEPEPYIAETKNGWIRVFRTIVRAGLEEYGIDQNPLAGLRYFPDATGEVDIEGDHTNALNLEETPRFLAQLRLRYPQWYAMGFLGIAVGSRPSTLRPLRRQGLKVDYDPEKMRLVLRRSNSRAHVIMNRTKTQKKTKKPTIINLTQEVCDVLDWHIETQLETGLQQASEFLFPAKDGRMRSRSSLYKVFNVVLASIGIKKRFTPKGMRRTHTDLARIAGVPKDVRKSISGHETDQMVEHYSTIHAAEQRAAVGGVVDLMEKRRKKAPPLAGVNAGVKDGKPSGKA